MSKRRCCGKWCTTQRVVLVLIALLGAHHVVLQSQHADLHWPSLRGRGDQDAPDAQEARPGDAQDARPGVVGVAWPGDAQDARIGGVGVARPGDVSASSQSASSGAAAARPPASPASSKTAPSPTAAPPAPPPAPPAPPAAPKVEASAGAQAAPCDLFLPGDDASRELMRENRWLQDGREAAGRFDGSLRGEGALRLTSGGLGVASFSMGREKGTVALELTGSPVLELDKLRPSCSLAVLLRPGDRLALAAGKGQLRLGDVRVLSKECPGDLGRPRGPLCLPWQRVRVGFSGCGGSNPGGKVGWLEARVIKLVNATHAAVRLTTALDKTVVATGKAAFDPKSQLVSYSDQGSCGARGDDAKLDASSCPDGAELVESVPNKDYRVVARVKGCNYFAYDVYRCSEVHRRRRSAQLVLPASQLSPLPDDGSSPAATPAAALAAPPCAGFQDDGRRIAILLVGDVRFQKRYERQIDSHRCYARLHGYDLIILSGSEYPVCQKYYDFFFKKHCTVAEFLETQGEKYVAAVVDADVVVANLNRGLETWANHDSDVQLYTRCLLPEIMAGNYMVRNTPFARQFLRNWASYNFKKPRGFSSSDNGALHLVVMETVYAKGVSKCRQKYKSLKKSSMDLSDYFDFVACCTDRLGPPRTWRAPGGKLTIWPRLHFFAADGVYMNKIASDDIGPPMHHGIKDTLDVTGHYYRDISKCQLNEALVTKSAEQMGQVALHLLKSYKKYFPQGRDCTGRECMDRCISTYSCWPLANDEAPLPRRTCRDVACTEADPEPP